MTCSYLIDGECPCLLRADHRGLHLCKHVRDMDGGPEPEPSQADAPAVARTEETT